MRISKLFLSSAFVGMAILGANTAYGQCSGGNCPVYGPYDQTPGYPSYQDNRYVQGNQNPNWQGNQNAYWRNDNGWREGNSLSYGNQMNSLDNEHPNMFGNADAPATEHFSSPSSNFATGNFNNTNSAASVNDPTLNNRFTPSNSNTFATSKENTPAANNTYAATTPDTSVDQHSYFQNQQGQNYFYQDLSQGNKAVDTKDTATKGDSDTLVRHKISDALKNNYLRKNYNDLTISINNGNVTISGRVDTDEDRADAESRVKGIQGVKSVNNQIQVAVAPSNSENTSDRYDGSYHISNEDLQKQVDSTIKNNYVKKNYDSVSATAFNGIVTLKGTVETDRDRQEIKERVLKLRGVRNIQDDLKVSSSTSQTSLRNSKKLNNSR